MNLPNKLSLLRICLIPVFVALALVQAQWAQIAATAVFCVASATDALDGYIARSRNLVTDFGKFLDPIADKLLVMAAFVALTGDGRMPSWVCIVLLAREFIISGLRQVAVTNGRVIAAGNLGKLKTVSQMFATIFLFLFVPVVGEPILGEIGVRMAQALMYVAFALTLWSGVDYLVRNRDVFMDGPR